MAHAIFRSPLMIQEYARNIKKMEHNIGPCPHCTKIGLNLKFISKERFKKHQFALCHYAKKELNVDENASTANYKISTTVLFASTLVVN